MCLSLLFCITYDYFLTLWNGVYISVYVYTFSQYAAINWVHYVQIVYTVLSIDEVHDTIKIALLLVCLV